MERTIENLVNDIRKVSDGLEILQKYSVNGRTERLRYDGVGVEVTRLPDEEAQRLLDLGWGWSADCGEGNQLWVYAW